MDWERALEALLRKIQDSINRQLERQYEQLVESLYNFLDDLFNYPLERPWRESLAIFAEHWSDRSLKLTGRAMAAIEELIAERIGGSIAVALAEAPLGEHWSDVIGTDAVLPMAPAPIPEANPDTGPEADAQRERGLRRVAAKVAEREQQRLQLSDDERAHYEFHIYENLRRVEHGWPLLEPPDYWLDKDFAYRQRVAARPAMGAIGYEEAEQSRKDAIRAGYGTQAEQEKLAREDLLEAKRRYREQYGDVATFLCPAFDGTGTLNDLMSVYSAMGGGVPGLTPGQASARPLASPRRGRHGGSSGQPRKARPEKKPALPKPADKVRVTIRRGRRTPDPKHVISAASEEAAARFIQTLPYEVVLFWGKRIGTHGADVVSYNLRTKTVALWDVKWRGSPRRIQASTTFEKGSDSLQDALREAAKAIRNSQLSNEHKEAAIRSIDERSVQDTPRIQLSGIIDEL